MKFGGDKWGDTPPLDKLKVAEPESEDEGNENTITEK